MLARNDSRMFLECSSGIFELKMAPLILYAGYHLFSFQKRTVWVRRGLSYVMIHVLHIVPRIECVCNSLIVLVENTSGMKLC